MNVLIIEDEERVVSLVRACIESDGHSCSVAYSGEQGLCLFKRHLPDAVILDLGLPDLSGLDVCSRIRQLQHLKDPVILMLTARTTEIDRIVGYASGADDYIAKPFSPQELPVRLRAVARRFYQKPAVLPAVTSPVKVAFVEAEKCIQIPHLQLDPEHRQVTLQNDQGTSEMVNLSSLEFELLYILASKPKRVWTRGELLEVVRGGDFIGDERSIDSYVKRIRAKISPKHQRDKFIKTHISLGYSFEDC